MPIIERTGDQLLFHLKTPDLGDLALFLPAVCAFFSHCQNERQIDLRPAVIDFLLFWPQEIEDALVCLERFVSDFITRGNRYFGITYDILTNASFPSAHRLAELGFVVNVSGLLDLSELNYEVDQMRFLFSLRPTCLKLSHIAQLMTMLKEAQLVKDDNEANGLLLMFNEVRRVILSSLFGLTHSCDWPRDSARALTELTILSLDPAEFCADDFFRWLESVPTCALTIDRFIAELPDAPVVLGQNRQICSVRLGLAGLAGTSSGALAAEIDSMINVISVCAKPSRISVRLMTDSPVNSERALSALSRVAYNFKCARNKITRKALIGPQYKLAKNATSIRFELADRQ